MKLNIKYITTCSMDITGEYHATNSLEGWIDRYSNLNNNYYIRIEKGRPHLFFIFLSLRNYKASDILLYKGKSKTLKGVYNLIDELIVQIDKDEKTQQKIEDWKKEQISYCFDYDLNFVGTCFNTFNSHKTDRERFLYDYYNQNPVLDYCKVKWEYWINKDWLYEHSFVSYGYCCQSVKDDVQKQKIKQLCDKIKFK